MAEKLTHKIIHEFASINDNVGFITNKENIKKQIVVAKESISSGIMQAQDGTWLIYHVAYIEELCTKARYDEWEEKKKVKKFGDQLHKA